MIKISAKDFGPIVEGEFELRPLTVFLGPGNSGKSYMATLAYCLMQSLSTTGSFYFRMMGELGYRGGSRKVAAGKSGAISPEFKIDGDAIDSLEKWAQTTESAGDLPPGAVLDSLPQPAKDGIDRLLKNSLQYAAADFEDQLLRCYGSIESLRNRRASAAGLRVQVKRSDPSLNLRFSEQKSSLKAASVGAWDYSPAEHGIDSLLSALALDLDDWRLRGRTEPARQPYLHLLGSITSSIGNSLFHDFSARYCFYLPAARAGMAQGYKAMASALVKHTSLAGVRPYAGPALSGIATDFIAHMLSMRSDVAGANPYDLSRQCMASVVDFLEREVVRGKIDVVQSGDVSYPEIFYAPVVDRHELGQFPLHSMSSMVSELAPVVLFLRYLVNPGDMLILEEPEAHLHPAMQRRMARAIARLVNVGVKVIVTTHSDFFVDQLNNLIKLNRASRQKRKKEGYEKEDCLDAESVGAYYFSMDDEKGGSIIEKLPVTRNSGIEEEAFLETATALYEESVSLQRIRGN